MPAGVDFLTVTELAGDEVSVEQVDRLYERYRWALPYCKDKDVLEAACGTGQGLGALSREVKSLQAGDYSAPILRIAQNHYGARIKLLQFDAQEMPFPDEAFDVVVLFEAIYYLPSAEKFVASASRVLRPGGKILITTANKDLYDFSPSPHSFSYYGVVELEALFKKYHFETEFFGGTPLKEVSWKQRCFRPVKKIASNLGLIPKTMAGKKFLKRIVFGKLISMPAEMPANAASASFPARLEPHQADRRHKVIYCVAAKRSR